MKKKIEDIITEKKQKKSKKEIIKTITIIFLLFIVFIYASSDTEQENLKLKNDIEVLNTQLLNFTEKSEELNTIENQNEQNQISNLQNTIKELQEKITSLENEKIILDTKIKELEEKNSTLEGDKQNLNSQIEELKKISQTTTSSTQVSTKNSTTSTKSSTKSTPQAQPSTDTNSQMVWVGNTGNKYHYQSCRTLKGNGHQITLQQALSEGREACKVCH